MNEMIANESASTVCSQQVNREDEVSPGVTNMSASLLVDTITNLNTNNEFCDQSKNVLTTVDTVEQQQHQQSLSKHNNNNNNINNNNNDNNNKRNNTNIDNSSINRGAESNTSSERRYRPQKYCAVCGDKAIACNFNAVTCESCKAFFRRNAFKEQRLKCLFDSCCIIDRVTRRFCSKCRLLKCFQIGMKREWILTDEQKQIKREKIQLNKQSRLQISAASSPSQSEDSPKQHVVDQHHPYHHQEKFNLHTDGALIDSMPTKNRRRQSSLGGSSNSSSGGSIKKVETKDATTSCTSTQADIAHPTNNNRLIHYCSLASQCQYCSNRLTTIQNMNDYYSLRTHQQHHPLPVISNQILYTSSDIERLSEDNNHHQSSNNFDNIVNDRACTSQAHVPQNSQSLCSSNCCCYFRSSSNNVHHNIQVNHLSPDSKQHATNELVPMAQSGPDSSFQQVPQLHLMTSTPTQVTYFADENPSSMPHKFQPQFINGATASQSYYTTSSTRASSNDSLQESIQIHSTQEAGAGSSNSSRVNVISFPTNCLEQQQTMNV